MRLDYLALKGITCFSEAVEIDFTTIPAGLIAIVGENGKGKTTLMEAPTGAVYGELPTRGAVAKYATGTDSYIDVRFMFDRDGAIRARRNIDGVKGTQSAALERGSGERLNDGKVTTFKAAVDGIFPTLDTLLASALAVQNRKGSFASRNRTDRKDLFYALLGLGRFEQYATTCRSAVSVLDKRIAELRGRVSTLEETAGDAQQDLLHNQANALHVDVMAAEVAKRDADAALAAADAELVRLRAEVQAAAAMIAERATLDAQLSECQRRRTFFATQDEDLNDQVRDQQKAIDGRLATAVRKIEDALATLPTDDHLQAQRDAAVSKASATLSEFVTERQARIDKNQRVIDGEQDIRAAVEETQAAQKRLVEIKAQLADARKTLERARTSEAAAATQVRELDAALKELTALERSAAFLLTVPCGGEGGFASCQFLKEAAEARTRAESMSKPDMTRALEQAQRRHQDEVSAVEMADTAIAHHEGEIARAEERIADLSGKAGLLPHLEAAKDKIAGYTQDIAGARATADHAIADADRAHADARLKRDADRTRLERDRDSAQALRTQELADLDAKTTETRVKRAADRAANDAEAERLTAELAKTADAAEAHQTSTAALAQHEATRDAAAAAVTAAATAFARVEEQVVHLNARREAFAAARGQWDAAKAGLTRLEDERIEWHSLAQMFGREGLSVLEIDSAGPGVSDGANDLLQACYDGRFAVELVTQEPTADGKSMKEVFELKVYDHERGGEARDLADLSGGEQVIVDSALRLAIALWMNRRNEQPIRTVWLDETTGALDPDNAQRYLTMLRRLHERAGLHHLIFVSHNPHVSAQADAQLQVADGKVTVAYPPFAAAVPRDEEAA